MRRHLLVSGFLCLALILSACEMIGPRALRAGRTDYNAAMKSTDVEQLLLNIVRMRFSDKPYFLTIASVSATTEFEALFGGSGDKGVEGRATYLERPNIVYIPLTGAEFVSHMLTPIDLNTLQLLRGAGWELDEIFRVFSDRINDTPNAPTAADASLEDVPQFRAFLDAVEPLDELEDAGKIMFAASEESDNELIMYVEESAREMEDFHTFTKNIQARSRKGSLSRSHRTGKWGGDEIVVQTRPILSAFFYLGHSIELPDSVRSSGAAHTILDENGEPYDWSDLFEGLITIHSSESRPSNAYTAVPYGDYWYYIDNLDVDSKETLSMVGIVLALKASGVPTSAPLLTLPVTGQ